jgi:hypothetical protein
MNREDRFCVSKLWIPLICSLKDHRKLTSQDYIDGFSMGPCSSLNTAFSRAPSLSFLGTCQPKASPSCHGLPPLPLLLLSPTTCLWPTCISSPTLVLCPPHSYDLSSPCSQICTCDPFRADASCLLLVHCVVWDSQWELTSCCAVPSCFLCKPSPCFLHGLLFLLPASCWFPACLIFHPLRWRRYVSLEHQLTATAYRVLYPRGYKCS